METPANQNQQEVVNVYQQSKLVKFYLKVSLVDQAIMNGDMPRLHALILEGAVTEPNLADVVSCR